MLAPSLLAPQGPAQGETQFRALGWPMALLRGPGPMFSRRSFAGVEVCLVLVAGLPCLDGGGLDKRPGA